MVVPVVTNFTKEIVETQQKLLCVQKRRWEVEPSQLSCLLGFVFEKYGYCKDITKQEKQSLLVADYVTWP